MRSGNDLTCKENAIYYLEMEKERFMAEEARRTSTTSTSSTAETTTPTTTTMTTTAEETTISIKRTSLVAAYTALVANSTPPTEIATIAHTSGMTGSGVQGSTTSESTKELATVIVNRTRSHRPSKKSLVKKASLRLLILNVCILFVLTFQLIFIGMLRNAHRESYEKAVREYIRKQKRMHAKFLATTSREGVVSRSKESAKHISGSAESVHSVHSGEGAPTSSGEDARRIKEKTMEAKRRSVKMKLSPFKWKSPHRTQSDDDDVTDLYLGSKSKGGKQQNFDKPYSS